MQAEYSTNRKNGFIISPDATSYSSKKPEKVFDTQNRLSKIKGALSDASEACHTYTKVASKRISKKIISAVIAFCCLLGIFKIFTISTGVYIGNIRIAYAQDKESFISAYSDAKAISASYGICDFDTAFSTSAVLSLRSDIFSTDELRDQILLSSGIFSRACSLYIEDSKIFDAENQTVAENAVKEYISTYSMNGDATLSAEPQYKDCIIPKTTILTKDQCIEKLQNSDVISVVSVVNSTSSKVLPFETHTENDDSMFIGETHLVTEGKNGNIQITEETVYENGEEQSFRVASEKITVQPVNRVVKIGTKYKKVLECGLFYPLKGTLSSPFGERWGSVHEGIDIAVAEGTNVKSAECGKVVRASENAGGYGKLIVIDHGYGVETYYAHLSEIQVSEGQYVSADTVIGLSGNTGRSTGPHLHFEIVESGIPVDPLKYLK